MSASCEGSRRIELCCAAFLVCLTGCATSPTRPTTVEVAELIASSTTHTARAIVPAAAELPASPSGPLGLDDLLALTSKQNPDLAAAQARATEASGQVVQSGAYPNPTVGYVGNQINDGPGTAGQQGVFVNQEIVMGDKLQVARQAASHGLAAADAQAVSRWYEACFRVRSAYFELLTARATLKESEKIVEQFETGLRKAESLAKAGTVLGHEVLRFRVELAQARNRVGTARERQVAAERLLACAIGVNQLPAPVAESELTSKLPALDFEQAVSATERGSNLAEAVAMSEQAREQVRLAELQNSPNLQVQTAAMYDFAIKAPMANVQVGFTLPFWNRNEGNILAAQGRFTQAQASVSQTRLRLRERLATAQQKYVNSRRQIDVYEKQILPDAKTAMEQVEAIYQARGERFFETLDARRTLAQARIDFLQAVGDAWQALSEIQSLIQAAQ